jgi:anti-sigma factor ChrR (cupin superfamily)
MGIALTCRECAGSLSDYRDGVLPLRRFLKMRMHLFNCPDCRALLATLRALPELAARSLAPDPAGAGREARRALDAVLERLRQPDQDRAWARTPVPDEARRLLEGDPDEPLRLLGTAHGLIARERTPQKGIACLPRPVLEQLPDPQAWVWEEDADGARRTELLAEPQRGVRLLLVYAPPRSAFPPHQHLGSESILVLDGSMADQGGEFLRGGWAHHPEGSCHAPRTGPDGCWCLVREEGTVRLLDPDAWLACVGNAS